MSGLGEQGLPEKKKQGTCPETGGNEAVYFQN